jgi:hypothetical protein
LGFHDKSIVRYQVIVHRFGLFFVFVEIVKEIVHFLFDLDGYGVIQGDMMLGLDGGTTKQRRNGKNREGLKQIVHIAKVSPTCADMQPSIEDI